MPVKLIALYKRPEDIESFLRHYEQVHTPLVRKIPGLQDLVVSRLSGLRGGDGPYFQMAEMIFADRSAFDTAMRSPENRAAGTDLMNFAGDLVTLSIAEVQ